MSPVEPPKKNPTKVPNSSLGTPAPTRTTHGESTQHRLRGDAKSAFVAPTTGLLAAQLARTAQAVPPVGLWGVIAKVALGAAALAASAVAAASLLNKGPAPAEGNATRSKIDKTTEERWEYFRHLVEQQNIPVASAAFMAGVDVYFTKTDLVSFDDSAAMEFASENGTGSFWSNMLAAVRPNKTVEEGEGVPGEKDPDLRIRMTAHANNNHWYLMRVTKDKEKAIQYLQELSEMLPEAQQVIDYLRAPDFTMQRGELTVAVIFDRTRNRSVLQINNGREIPIQDATLERQKAVESAFFHLYPKAGATRANGELDSNRINMPNAQFLKDMR